LAFLANAVISIEYRDETEPELPDFETEFKQRMKKFDEQLHNAFFDVQESGEVRVWEIFTCMIIVCGTFFLYPNVGSTKRHFTFQKINIPCCCPDFFLTK
jgi:hypothetical protein